MVPFAGWALPVQYPTGPIREHHAVRKSVGLFDISHMGRLRLEGAATRHFLQRVMTRNLDPVRPGSASYGLIAYADGTVADDVIAVHLESHWLLVTNGVNRAKILAWLQAHSSAHDVTISDETRQTAMLAVQGPQACALLSRLLHANLQIVGRFRVWQGTYQDHPVLLTRTGYTGEDGFEIICPAETGSRLFHGLLEAGATCGVHPCGLAARDSLRLEQGYPLYGHEISSTISPLEAGLGWAVSFRKPDFIGRDALLKQKLEGLSRRLVGFQMVESGVPRARYDVFRENVWLGQVTSGNKSPTLNRFIGLALCTTAHDPLEEITIDIRGQHRRAEVVPVPFVSRLH